MRLKSTYHKPCQDSNTPATVCVGNDVAITDGEEGYGDHPHGIENIGVFHIVMAENMRKKARLGKQFNDLL